MQVTVDMFSGRPNPTWRLSTRRSSEVYERCRAMGATPRRADVIGDVVGGRPVRLGLRGIDIGPAEPGEFGLSPGQRFTVAASVSDVTDDEIETARWLIDTTDSTVDDAVVGALEEQIGQVVSRRTAAESGPDVAAAAAESLATSLSIVGCAALVTPMRLGYWNTPFVQPYNNCYNYATNFVSGSLAQPGRRSGLPYAGFTCEHVLAAAQRDGLELQCGRNVGVVALGVWPGFDFHWWRLHPGDSWAHKIGYWPAQNVDNAFRPLVNGLTPANCDRGPYVQFCGYYFVPMSMWVL